MSGRRRRHWTDTVPSSVEYLAAIKGDEAINMAYNSDAELAKVVIPRADAGQSADRGGMRMAS